MPLGPRPMLTRRPPTTAGFHRPYAYWTKAWIGRDPWDFKCPKVAMGRKTGFIRRVSEGFVHVFSSINDC